MKTCCKKTRREITAWHDLTERQRRRVREHTTDCVDCHTELDAMLALLGQLEESREAYGAMRYTGPKPRLHSQRPLTPARGIKTIPSRGFWRPLPVALAGGLFAISLATSFFFIRQPLFISQPELKPEPAASNHHESAWQAPPRPRMVPPGAPLPSLGTIRREAGGMRMPAAPKRPSRLQLRLPSRPTSPTRADDGDLQPGALEARESNTEHGYQRGRG